MARSTYYYHRPRLGEDEKEKELKDSILKIYHAHKGRYGIRRITSSLRNAGMIVNHKRVERIMKELGLKSLVRPKKYNSYKGKEGTVAPNIIKRDFKADKPYIKLATDVSEFKICGIKIYLSAVLDMYNGEIISYTLYRHPSLMMVIKMLEKAIRNINPAAGSVIHSDQGWHYQHKEFQDLVHKYDMVQSMSRKGNCLDNAKMESFFAVLKSEFLYLQKFTTVEQFKKELKKYIQYYNNNRIKVSLNNMSPVKYRTQYI